MTSQSATVVLDSSSNSEPDAFLKKLALAQKGNAKAMNDLFNEFLFLVKIEAGLFFKKGTGLYYSYEDLFQEGSIGLIFAIQKSNRVDSIGCFVSYAKKCIKGKILDALRNNSDFSRFILEGSRCYNKIRHNLEQKLIRKPSVFEIEELLPNEFKQIELIRLMNEENVTMSASISLFGGEIDGSVFDYLPNNDATIEDLCYQAQLFDRIKGFLSGSVPLLNKGEKKVLNLYYFSELGLKEIGELTGVTESRVCQVKNSAIRKIQQKLK